MPAVVMIVALGCQEDQIRVYEAPADPLPERGPEPPHGTQADSTGLPPGHPPLAAADEATSGAMEWTLPDGWQLLEEERPMRIATLQAGEGHDALEVAISAFPGMTGGIQANVNRWREQFGLLPLSEAELDEHLHAFDSEADERVSGWTIRIEGQTAQARPGTQSPTGRAMLGAIIEGDPARTWFIRADGDPDVLDLYADDFEQLVRTFRFVKSEADAASEEHPPAGKVQEEGPDPRGY